MFRLLAILSSGFILLRAGCSNLMHGNDVQVVEEATSVAQCEYRGPIQVSVRVGPDTDGEALARDLLTDEAREVGADTVYRMTTDESFGEPLIARATAYFCDRSNRPQDFKGPYD